MTKPDEYIELLMVSNVLREPILRAAIDSLELPAGSLGLDAGCGVGLQALLLSEAVGPTGHITCLDLSSVFLRRAKKIIDDAGLSAQVSLKEGDLHHLPFEDDAFDWVWSADCAGYPDHDPVSLVRELARVVRPGGTVAILAWSSQSLLPGHPWLETRLNGTSSGIAPFTKEMSPEIHFSRALGWFKKAGLGDLAASTQVHTVHAPLTEEIRNALMALLEMRWGAAKEEMTEKEWTEYQRLIQPSSPDFILDLADYVAFFTCSLFCGRA